MRAVPVVVANLQHMERSGQIFPAGQLNAVVAQAVTFTRLFVAAVALEGGQRKIVGYPADNVAREHIFGTHARGAHSECNSEIPAVTGPTDRAKETVVTSQISDPHANRLLAMLPRSDYSDIAPLMTTISLGQGTVLHHPGDEVEQVWFPHEGMVSLLAIMADGRAVETATVGLEGVLGGMAGLGLHKALTRAVVQLPLVASRISAAAFRKAVRLHDPMRNLIVRANDALLGQVQITAACNALHPIEARLARWILQSSDRTIADEIPLTQELLSQMLGVTRSSVSEVASKLQAAGLIRYVRGNIQITNRAGLEQATCECYFAVRDVSGLR